MSLRIAFELDDDDLAHFRLIMTAARENLSRRAPEDIIAAANDVLDKIRRPDVPGFIGTRLERLERMIQMISDLDWRMPHDDTQRVLNALAYFAEPDDLIPDQIPGLGFLDDAIMVELVVRELEHEISAYQDFCDYRDTLKKSDVSALAARRDELLARMQEQRQRARQENDPAGQFRLLD
ncbi:MAG: YkvA family protein [Pseudomonadota bacterium]